MSKNEPELKKPKPASIACRWCYTVVLFALLLTPLVGCANMSNNRNRPNDLLNDQLWREGYGFNNPNPERRRQGLAPINFDGSIEEERHQSIAENVIGSAIGNAISNFGNFVIDTFRR